MRNRRYAARFFGGAFIAIALAFSPLSTGWAQEGASTPMVTGQVVRDFARITFHWPERVDSFSADSSGNRLTVRFDRPVRPNFGEILRTLYPYVTKADLAGDGRTIIFTMNNAYKTRSFITDSQTGIDILSVSKTSKTPAPEAETETAAAAPVAPKPAPKPAEPKPAEPKPAPKAVEPPKSPMKVVPVPSAKPAAPSRETIQATAAPVVEVTETPAATPAPVTPAPTPPAPEVEPVPVVEAPAPAPAPEPAPASAPVAAPTPVAPAPTITLTNEPASVVLKQAMPANTVPIIGDPMTVTLGMQYKQPQLTFPFTDRVAAATWMRGRTAWVLFNKPYKLNGLEAVQEGSKGWLAGIRQYGGEGITLLRMDLVTDLYAIAEKDREGYAWNVRISSSPVLPVDPVAAELTTQNGKTSAFIPVGEASGPYPVFDQSSNESMLVLPVYASGTGLSPARSFIEFILPTTAQGIVVSPLADGVAVTRDERGIYVNVEGGMTVSDEARAASTRSIKKGDSKAQLYKPTFFPNREWAATDEEDFQRKRTYYLTQAADAQNMLERSQWRKKLAELYFSAGMENEVLGVLANIRRDDIDFFRDNKLAAMEGASHFINYRLPEAALSMSSNVLDDSEEALFLRKVIAAAGSSDSEPVPYMLYNDAYLRQYPRDLRQRIAIIAANQAIQQRDFKTPTEIFASLEEDDKAAGIEDYITFMKARVTAESGKPKEAARTWKEMASNVDDRQFRARAELALILQGLQDETIAPEEALERLDKLRIVWRGDDLERSVLMLVGQLNVNEGDYWDGMKAWEELMQYFPNTPESNEAYRRLAETFRSLFLDGEANDADPVKAIALYGEFQELTPIGDEGNKVVQNIVDLEVKIDLLDQAAERLQKLVQFRLKGEEKSRAGARLAVINLLNRAPEKAIAALQMSREEDVPAALSLERNRIAAQALIDMKNYDQALMMIEGDFSTEGEAVRLDANTKKEDWAYVVDILENILRSRPDLTAPFTEEEGRQLVQLCLAYIFLGETEQLSYLREAYTPLMAENKYKDEFKFFTQDNTASGQDFKKVTEGINNMQDFMNGYRKKLKETPLSKAVGDENAPAPAGGEAAAPANPQ
ncbi:MAG: hypothetical protein FJX23_02895 [Alphaproteobacteria bacterium]|nr:hypothetical protein [Alphaproteobacteria bacterium]